MLAFLPRNVSNTEIARELGVTPTTIKMHLRHIFKKMGVHDKMGVVLTALAQGLLTLTVDARTGAPAVHPASEMAKARTPNRRNGRGDCPQSPALSSL